MYPPTHHLLTYCAYNSPEKGTPCQFCGRRLPCHLRYAPVTPCPALNGRPGLGDYVERALARIGITKARYTIWKTKLLRDATCGCTRRQKGLNRWWHTVIFWLIAKTHRYFSPVKHVERPRGKSERKHTGRKKKSGCGCGSRPPVEEESRDHLGPWSSELYGLPPRPKRDYPETAAGLPDSYPYGPGISGEESDSSLLESLYVTHGERLQTEVQSWVFHAGYNPGEEIIPLQPEGGEGGGEEGESSLDRDRDS